LEQHYIFGAALYYDGGSKAHLLFLRDAGNSLQPIGGLFEHNEARVLAQ